MRRDRRNDEGEEHHRDRRSVADVVIGEGDAVEVEVDRFRRRAGPALRDGIDDVEAFQGIDGADDHGYHQERRDHRQRDVAEALEHVRAVDGGALIGFYRDRREAAQHDQHDERRPLPCLDENERRDHGRGMEDPGLRSDADQGQEIVEHAELRVEHHRPDKGDGDRRRHHRHDEYAAQDAPQRHLGVEDQGRERAEDQAAARQPAMYRPAFARLT